VSRPKKGGANSAEKDDQKGVFLTFFVQKIAKTRKFLQVNLWGVQGCPGAFRGVQGCPTRP
jgi:hypothetical protein